MQTKIGPKPRIVFHSSEATKQGQIQRCRAAILQGGENALVKLPGNLGYAPAADRLRYLTTGIIPSTSGYIVVPEMINFPDRALKIGKAPVSNEEMGEFIKADGYNHRPYWTRESWDWKTKNGISSPEFWRTGENKSGLAHPGDRAIISGYEAEAYINFLVERTGRAFRLPTIQELADAKNSYTLSLSYNNRSRDWELGSCQEFSSTRISTFSMDERKKHSDAYPNEKSWSMGDRVIIYAYRGGSSVKLFSSLRLAEDLPNKT
jgi:hypothetical protein